MIRDYEEEEGVLRENAKERWMCPSCWKWVPFDEVSVRSTLMTSNNTTTVRCQKGHLLASWVE